VHSLNGRIWRLLAREFIAFFSYFPVTCLGTKADAVRVPALKQALSFNATRKWLFGLFEIDAEGRAAPLVTSNRSIRSDGDAHERVRIRA
jgi:hypothetical protein